jgi:glycine reductase complex component B subunit gamma
MAEKIRVAHYLNQFFAQVGGEEKANIGPGLKEGPIGPGRALQQRLAEHGEVVATFFCGDNYFAEHSKEATEELLRQMVRFDAQLLIAGPAFESGRYGVACGAIGQAAQERLSIPAVAGMDAENAGTGVYRKKVYIVDSGSSVVRMAPVLQRWRAWMRRTLEPLFIASTSTSSTRAIQSCAWSRLSGEWLPWGLNWCSASG